MSSLEARLGVGAVSWRYVPANQADDIRHSADDITRPTELGTGFR